MSVCPFCKAQVTSSTAPCPRCGKLAAEHPSIAAIGGRTLSTDFDDDDVGGLDLEASGHVGASSKQHAAMPFEGGKGLTLDDDLFGDGEAAGPLELDVPDLPAPPPPSNRTPHVSGAPAAATPSRAPASDPRLAAAAASAPPSAPKPARGSDPRMAAPPPAASSSGRLPAAPPSPDPGAVEAAPVSEREPPSAEDQAAIRIANFPAPPEKIWFAPRYAVQVFLRRFELRQDLDALRRKRSPDVRLYERALEAHDPKMYRAGLALTGAAIFLALVLFFMPVIKRFAFAPD